MYRFDLSFFSAQKFCSTPSCCISRFYVVSYDCYREDQKGEPKRFTVKASSIDRKFPRSFRVFRPWALPRMTRFDRLRGFERKSLPAEAKLFSLVILHLLNFLSFSTFFSLFFFASYPENVVVYHSEMEHT